MGFKTKFGFIFLEAIGLAPEGRALTEPRIWDRRVLGGVRQWATEKEQKGTNFLITLLVFTYILRRGEFSTFAVKGPLLKARNSDTFWDGAISWFMGQQERPHFHPL